MPLPRSAAEARAQEDSMFRKYSVPVAAADQFARPAIRLDTRLKRRYRTQLRYIQANEPTVADSVAYGEWGCGTGCFQFALVDLQTGEAYIFPHPVQAYAVGQRVDHRRGSSAVHVVGQLGDGAGADDWYRWDGHALRLLSHRRIPDDCFSGDKEELRHSAACGFMPDE